MAIPFTSVRFSEGLYNIIGVSYQSINVNGSLDKLSQKMVRGFLAEYFTGQKPLQRVMQISQQIMAVMPLSETKSRICTFIC